MLKKVGRLFVIKTNWEAYLIIYALALGKEGSIIMTIIAALGLLLVSSIMLRMRYAC